MVQKQYSDDTLMIQKQYSVDAVTIQKQYSDDTVMIQKQYSVDAVTIQKQYSVDAVPIQKQYSDDTVMVQKQHSDDTVMVQKQYSDVAVTIQKRYSNDSVTIQKRYSNDSMGCLFSHSERMIRVPIPKEHPYQSHISRFALFPTFRSPDDPDTGVRAASQRPLNPLVPASAPQVTVLRKTKGRGPYRHEVLQAPKAMRKSTITWPGQHGRFSPKGIIRYDIVFYPMALKSVFPNPSLRDWGVTLSERTANTLHNLEKSLWATSYQLDFTGSGPSNPLRMDDFHEKTIAMITGKMTPYTAQLVCTVTTNLMNKVCKSILMEIQDQKRQNREITEIPCSISNPCIQPRPPVLPSTQPGEGGGVLAGGGNAPNCRHQSSLLELQDSFSKSEVHRRFRSSLQGGPVNLQDNVHAGRKHHFYGFNSYYFHD
uniref:Uncharacterized protein n=1 Tax=Esox lucius TaxID=8010 RepID=A0A6Q2ZHG8_ESOLU